MPRTITEIATAAGRDYITPEDVGEAIRGGLPKADVQQEVLDVLGRKVVAGRGWGAEDRGLCAFVASDYDRVLAEDDAD